ncbi:hypothetical protein AAE478_007611 [Parahypoxylon ruwenzoriense]
MGHFCGLPIKDSDADQHEKPFDDSSPGSSKSIHPFRQIFNLIMAGRPPKSVYGALPYRFRPGLRPPVQLTFQDAMEKSASLEEREAMEIINGYMQDDERLYSATHPITGHFSRNVDIIEKTKLLEAARDAPKAAHLHIHFNSTLLPEFLLGVAKGMPNMYISSATHKLRSKDDFDNCEIVFTLRDVKAQPKDLVQEDKTGPNLFQDTYEPAQKMRYQYFRAMWTHERDRRQKSAFKNGSRKPKVWAMDMDCDAWLVSKLIFSRREIDQIFDPAAKPSIERVPELETEEEERARQKKAKESGWPKNIDLDFQNSQYINIRERATRAWERFNGRTRMMKGLFNYERAFRAYTRKCLEEFVMENVQYAEIRPNFMKNNQVLRDDGSGSANNFEVMEMVVDEYENFMKDIGDMDENGQIKENRAVDELGNPVYAPDTGIRLSNGHAPSLGGMKIIYCTPRSFDKDKVKEALEECIKMKKRWPQYIAGFDLVGEEAYGKPYPLSYFEQEFKQFQEDCQGEIPFLFHCGETPDDIEGNLDCALRLNSKRIGHGYALPEKPDILKRMKAQNICVEACPISNMVLGLTEHMDEHRIYDLLAHEVHCTLNSDNGTLFRSTLSHDFYEVMIGNRNMNLFGWRQLARWSIDHACMTHDERERVLVEWERRWKQEFIPGLLGKPVRRPVRLDRLAKIEKNRLKRQNQFRTKV